MRPRPILLAAATLAMIPALAASAPQADDEEGFRPLVEGTDPEQFQLVAIDSGTISIDDDGVVSLTGTPNGYFATKDEFGDYVLRFSWMYERPDDLADDASFDGNSGLLVHIEGEPKVWPKCIEVQLKNADAGHIFGLQGAEFRSTVAGQQRTHSQAEAIKPVGQWNEMEVVCKGGSIACRINGVLVDEGADASPSSGPIGWQSEGRPIRFRDLRIRPLD